MIYDKLTQSIAMEYVKMTESADDDEDQEMIVQGPENYVRDNAKRYGIKIHVEDSNDDEVLICGSFAELKRYDHVVSGSTMSDERFAKAHGLKLPVVPGQHHGGLTEPLDESQKPSYEYWTNDDGGQPGAMPQKTYRVQDSGPHHSGLTEPEDD